MRVHTNYPLTFVALPGEFLALRLTYDAERFAATDVQRLALRFSHALEQLVEGFDSPLGAIELVDEQEKHRLAEAWNRTDRDYPAPTDVVGRFEIQAAAAPNAIAARCCGRSLTYRALNEDANRLAHALIKAGVSTNEVVILLQDRSEEFLVSMLAILKAGAAYLPIDPAFPDNRISQIVQESRARWVLSGAEWLDRARRLVAELFKDVSPTVLSARRSLKADLCVANPIRRHGPRGLAFIIYTSGSTGQPKGVMVEHRGMYNNLITKVDAMGLTTQDVIAQSASQSFDISVWQFLTGLMIGARIEIVPDRISKDPSRMIEEIERCGVTILETVPSMIRALLDAASEVNGLEKLRWLMPCGEAFTPELCRRFMKALPSVKLLNAYGPAECSDDVSYHFIEEPPRGDDLSVPIGRPVDNTKIYVLNQWGDLAPTGVAGEIRVGGLQVGQGYLDRPDLTAKAFIPDSFGPAGSVLYRTGDLGRVNEEGVLEFLGRVDNQVKIRGHRIELGEIESCLVAHPGVQEACVVASPGRGQQWEIVAYVVAPGEAATNLRAHVVGRLPDFMAPSAFVLLEALPVSANGKVDRKRLPKVDLELTRPYVSPRNETEETLCGIWSEVLGVDRVGVDDNFFELGGHSLLIIQLRSKVRRAFGIEMPLKVLFESVTISSLATKIEEAIIAEIESMEDSDVVERLHKTVAAQEQ